jgi:hypothetical protein
MFVHIQRGGSFYRDIPRLTEGYPRMNRFLIATAAAVTIGAAIVPAHADVVLSGPDSNAGTYSTSQLSSLATLGDTATADNLTGISLWGLLGGANASSPTAPTYGGITTSTPTGDNGKNAIFRYYLVGSNAAGAQSVVSLGEIDPNFGGTAPVPAFVAYQTAGGTPLTTPTLVVPGAPGRDLTGLTSLTLLSVPALPALPSGTTAPPSTVVTLSGATAHPGSYDLAALKADFTPVQVPANSETYTGVPLWTFLGATTSNVTSQIVIAQATDGLEVVYSLAELDPALGGNPDDLLPYASTGGDFPGDGVARTIFPTDFKMGRWVSNLDSLNIVDAPEPASLVLLAAPLLPLGIIRNRRRRT